MSDPEASSKTPQTDLPLVAASVEMAKRTPVSDAVTGTLKRFTMLPVALGKPTPLVYAPEVGLFACTSQVTLCVQVNELFEVIWSGPIETVMLFNPFVVGLNGLKATVATAPGARTLMVL